MAEKITAVVAALLRENDRFLVFQRPADKARGLLWEYAGGKCEPGESPQEALIRECREELGCEIAVGEKYMEVIHKYPDLTICLTLYHASVAKGEIRLLEHNAVCAADAEALRTLPFCPADQPIIEKILSDFF